ncbi:MAG: hypothetical protein HFJ06_07450 [Lachnospiraceae bacterium]|nr:hypothetical protein [Lachnospiraceae bacterium]
MMKKIQLVMVVILAAGILSGCTNYVKEYDKNTLVVKKNGSLVEISVEDFKDSSVKAEDLTAYIEEQIDTYNSEYGKKMIKNKAIETEDMSKVKLVLYYKDMESYNGFNLLECTLSDFSDVKESELKGTFISAEGKEIKADDMENTEKAKVLIFPAAADVVMKGEILYHNNEVSVKDGVAVTSGEEDAIIIYK